MIGPLGLTKSILYDSKDCFDQTVLDLQELHHCQFGLSWVPLCRDGRGGCPQRFGKYSKFKSRETQISRIPPAPPASLLANFLRRNNFSVYCLQSCIMFRSWRRQIFCLIFRSMASAGNFLQGISNSPWKSNLGGNDFVQNSISQRILYLFLKIFKSICEKQNSLLTKGWCWGHHCVLRPVEDNKRRNLKIVRSKEFRPNFPVVGAKELEEFGRSSQLSKQVSMAAAAARMFQSWQSATSGTQVRCLLLHRAQSAK